MLVAMAVSTVEWADGKPTLTGHFHPEPGPEEAQTPARKKLLQYTNHICHLHLRVYCMQGLWLSGYCDCAMTSDVPASLSTHLNDAAVNSISVRYPHRNETVLRGWTRFTNLVQSSSQQDRPVGVPRFTYPMQSSCETSSG